MKTSLKKESNQPYIEDSMLSKKEHKKVPSVKTVEIFMNNLDRQINDSYAKLKRNREKTTTAKKESNLFEQTMPCAPEQTFQKTQESNYYVSFTHSPNRSQQQDQERSEIVLLENKEVMQYIHLVYDLYNIKDPLAEQTPSAEQERYMTNKKIKNFKDSFQKEIGTASTTKNSYMYKSIELNPFSEPKQGLLKKQSTSAAKIQVSLVSKNQSRANSNEKIQKQSSNKSSTFRLKNQNMLSKKQKINITATHRIKTQSSTGVVSVPQLFRFCFMCEEPILQCNLISHEQSCQPLKEGLHFSLEKLLAILDQKISRLIGQINSQLLEKAEQKIKEQFTAIKRSVKNWIVQLPPQSLTKNTMSASLSSPTSTYNKNWRGQFNKIEQKITNSVCSSFQLIHKLQWFSKLRENIAFKFFTSQ